MSLISYALSETSIVFRVKILDSSASTGAGLEALTFSSSGLIISTIADNEVSAVTYTQGGSTIETISTLGTYAAPTSLKCRFKEVDATNHKGVYEIQLADARFAVSSSKSLLVSISGATNVAQTDVVIPLTTTDPYAADFGLALTNANLAHVDSNEKIALLAATQTTIDDIPSTSEFNDRTIAAASYFDPTSDAVANVTLVATTTTNTDMVAAAPTAAANAVAVWDAVQSSHVIVGSFGIIASEIAAIPTTAMRGTDGANTATPLTAAGIRTAVGMSTANLDTQLGDIPTVSEFNDRTILQAAYFDPANDTVANVTLCATVTTLTNDAPIDEAAIFTTQMTESYAADGVPPTPAQALLLSLQRLTEFAIAGTTITIKKLDGSATAATLTLDDAASPTSSTRAS